MPDARSIARLLEVYDELPPGFQDPEEAPEEPDVIGDDPSEVSPRDIVIQATKPMAHQGTKDETYWLRHLGKIQRKRSGDRSRVKLENNTWAELLDYPTRHIGIRLHSTYVVSIYPDNSCVARTGGWSTNTTRDRINKYLPNNWGIYTHQGSWYWYNTLTRFGMWDDPSGIRQPFQSEDRIDSDGVLHAQNPPEYRRRRRNRANE